MCGAPVPPAETGWNSGAQISSVELDLHWGNTRFFLLFLSSLQRECFTSTVASVASSPSSFCFVSQDYASLSSLDIVVKASLVLHSPAKNMILGTPDTEVSSWTEKKKKKSGPSSSELSCGAVCRWRSQSSQKVLWLSSVAFPGGSFWWPFSQASWF